MSPPHLAQELLDLIVDHLHQDSDAIQECSFVSKSWIPRASKHLFEKVKFTTRRQFKLWERTFPVPLSSPGRYTKSLSICALCATFRSEEACSWIRAFPNVSSFKVYSHGAADIYEYNMTFAEENYIPFGISLVPFHGFSLVLKSLTIGISHLPPQEVLEFILSFPLLKDLTVHGLGAQNHYDEEEDQMNLQIPSVFPPLTGTLDLISRKCSLRFTVNRLLGLPNGIHFQALRLWLVFEEDSPSERRVATTRGLIKECSPTLKDLLIVFDGQCNICALLLFSNSFLLAETSIADAGNTSSFFLDLSMAARLETLTFRPWTMDVGWVIRTLATIPGDHINIKIKLVYDVIPVKHPARGLQFAGAVDPTIFRQWLRLDGLIVQLWESSEILTDVFCHDPCTGWLAWGVGVATGTLLPEATRRGVVTVEQFYDRFWLDAD
jgi:hypothetical protein